MALRGIKYRHPDEPKIYCCYCGRWIVYPLYLTIEHLVPVSAGGNNRQANKRYCCNACNKARGNMVLEDFLKQSQVEANRRAGVTIYHQRIDNIPSIIEYVNANYNKLIKL